MGISHIIMNLIDPLGIIRKQIIRPLSDFGFAVFEHYRIKTTDRVMTIRDLMLRAGIVSFALALIIWSAIFMYVAFYYTYMPAIAHTRPVFMQFESCGNRQGICTFPSAHVALTKKQQLLMVGQAYKVLVNIDMPESLQNQELGMFMVCADLRDQLSSLRGHSCRSAMMRYKSPLLRTITTWVLSPLFVAGLREEHQLVPVELFTSYEEEQTHPVTDVYVEIQSQQIQFYSVSLYITADFTGLRYIMFHWPILSAVFGISSNLFFILIVFILSWYHWTDTTWIKDAQEKYQSFRRTKSELSTSIDESNLVDDDDLSILEKSEDIEEISSGSGFDVELGDDDESKKQPKSTQTEYNY